MCVVKVLGLGVRRSSEGPTVRRICVLGEGPRVRRVVGSG